MWPSLVVSNDGILPICLEFDVSLKKVQTQTLVNIKYVLVNSSIYVFDQKATVVAFLVLLFF